MTVKKIFICSPYRGNVEKNVEMAREYTRFASICGYCPIAPHLLFPQCLDDQNPEERILGITLGAELMKCCDEMWIFGSQISNGMAYELEQARKLGIPIRMYDSDRNRIYPETMRIDDRITEEYRKAVKGLKFVD